MEETIQHLLNLRATIVIFTTKPEVTTTMPKDQKHLIRLTVPVTRLQTEDQDCQVKRKSQNIKKQTQS